jgi:hypothetical protein
MLQDVKLPFFPYIQDCMVWSSDGDIAIAAGDSVQIVVSPLLVIGIDAYLTNSNPNHLEP